jgi:hypothetical protein
MLGQVRSCYFRLVCLVQVISFYFKLGQVSSGYFKLVQVRSVKVSFGQVISA